jgi:hypothetical protein
MPRLMLRPACPSPGQPPRTTCSWVPVDARAQRKAKLGSGVGFWFRGGLCKCLCDVTTVRSKL